MSKASIFLMVACRPKDSDRGWNDDIGGSHSDESSDDQLYKHIEEWLNGKRWKAQNKIRTFDRSSLSKIKWKTYQFHGGGGCREMMCSLKKGRRSSGFCWISFGLLILVLINERNLKRDVSSSVMAAKVFKLAWGQHPKQQTNGWKENGMIHLMGRTSEERWRF